MALLVATGKDLDFELLVVFQDWDQERQIPVPVIVLAQVGLSQLQEDIELGWVLEQDLQTRPLD